MVDPEGVAGAAGIGQAAEALPGKVGEGQVDDRVAGGDAGGGGHAVSVAGWLQLAPQAVVHGSVHEDLGYWGLVLLSRGYSPPYMTLTLGSPHWSMRWQTAEKCSPGLDGLCCWDCRGSSSWSCSRIL